MAVLRVPNSARTRTKGQVQSGRGRTYTLLARADFCNLVVRRIQIHIDEALDDAAEAEAARRGQSKAALIRQALARELQAQAPSEAGPREAMIGWLDDGPVEDLDSVVYDGRR